MGLRISSLCRVLAMLLACLAWPAHAKPPNIVFILADDLGWADIHPNNPGAFYETPNLDRLAAGGMRFTQAYAACPVCSPTRASILTGKYPARLHLTDYIPGNRAEKLKPPEYLYQMPLRETTLAEALKTAGYATFFAGKWHLGGRGYYPEDQGFDINKGGYAAGAPFKGKGYFSPYGNPKLEDGPPGEHLPARLAQETTRFIEAHKDGPFLVYLSLYDVHIPLMGRKDLIDKYRAKQQALPHRGDEQRFGREGRRSVRLVQDLPVYAAMVDAMDQAIGQVLDKLDELKLADHTLVVFTSDNGGLSTSEGLPTSNLPLRAGKGWLYEGGIREPLIVRAAGVTRPGSVCDVPVISTDFYPMLLELAGLPLKPEQHLDGVSIVPLLRGGAKLNREALYWHYPHYGNQGSTPGGAVRAGDFKLIEWYEDGRKELYNLAQDLGEKRDLAAEMPEKVKQLSEMLTDWRRSVRASMPTPNPDYNEQAVRAFHERAAKMRAE